MTDFIRSDVVQEKLSKGVYNRIGEWLRITFPEIQKEERKDCRNYKLRLLTFNEIGDSVIIKYGLYKLSHVYKIGG